MEVNHDHPSSFPPPHTHLDEVADSIKMQEAGNEKHCNERAQIERRDRDHRVRDQSLLAVRAPANRWVPKRVVTGTQCGVHGCRDQGLGDVVGSARCAVPVEGGAS